ncbi:hypothetical protein MUG91_G144n6 [Manis pentadactyla]|nr:hypothetical protein MUG91_G144n6 [Manis pentadactyla]
MSKIVTLFAVGQTELRIRAQYSQREHLFRICCLQNPELQGALRICKACGRRGLRLTPHDGNIAEAWPRTEAPGEGGREDEQRDGKPTLHPCQISDGVNPIELQLDLPGQ